MIGDLNQCAVTDDCDVGEYKVIKNTKNYCYASACPADKPVYDDKKVCTEKCADAKNKYWTGTECKDTCPSDKPAHDEKNICKICADVNIKEPVWETKENKCRACDAKDGGTKWDPMTKQCVAECPTGRPLKDKDGTVCQTCE